MFRLAAQKIRYISNKENLIIALQYYYIDIFIPWALEKGSSDYL